MAAAAATLFEFVPERGSGGVESFASTRREKVRVRLSSDEARNVRYVFCEWSGESGFGSSSSSAQLERLAASPHLLGVDGMSDEGAAAALERAIASECEEAWRRAWLLERAQLQFMAVRGGMSSHYRGGPLSAIERWCDRALEPAGSRVVRSEFGDRVHHAWRALRLLADRYSRSLVVLHALYGDRPPGLLEGTLWEDSVNRDYVRVVRFVDEAGSSTTALEARLRVDKHRREQEGDDAFRTRVASAQVERWALLSRLGGACEALIEDATHAYRDAWTATS